MCAGFLGNSTEQWQKTISSIWKEFVLQTLVSILFCFA